MSVFLVFLRERVSLISKSDIRYSGEVGDFHSEESIVELWDVKSYGTESRKGKLEEEIGPAEKNYKGIVFRGSGIKDLSIEEGLGVKENKPPGSDIMDLSIEECPGVKENKPPGVPNDPAIVYKWGDYLDIASSPPIPSESMAEQFAVERTKSVPNDPANNAGPSLGQGRDISVIPEKSSEELFWESFDLTPKDDGMAAVRVIVPDNSAGKYKELREGSSFEPTPRDGQIGVLRKVSYGTFNDKEFETAHAWSYQECKFRKLNYFSDAKPPKFRVCLPEELDRREWMDFHESNLLGVIFEKTPEEKDHTHRVVYFVVDKPPQFYEEADPNPSSSGNANASRPAPGTTATNNGRCNLVKSRISCPSSLQIYADDELDVCGVPWIIQYSRVFKVEYDTVGYTYNECSVYPFGPRKHMEGEIFFHIGYPSITESKRTTSDMARTIRSNIQDVSKLFPPYLTGCQLGVVKLLYNCNVPATSPKTTSFLDKLIRHGLPRHSRQYSERLHKMSEDINTSHFRAFEDFCCDPKSIVTGDTRRISSNEPDQREPSLKPRYDPLFPDIPTNWAAESTQWHEDFSPGVFEVLVYPSHIEIQGPTDPPTNSVTDKYRHLIGRFLRVKFVDNNSEPLKVEAGIDLAHILKRRVFSVLTQRPNQSQLFHALRDLGGFEFLGYSMSSLKKRKAVWFFQRQDGLDAKAIRDQIGNWDVKVNGKLAYYPSKWGARISLAFTESYRVLSLSRADWELREDYGKNRDFRNTDGCGLISPELCNTINTASAPLGFARSRAFQIRFGGAKGVVYAGANSLLKYNGESWKLLLRNSQVKFEVPDSSKLDLRIVSTAGDGHRSLFFASALKAFEDSGADATKIEKIYNTTYHHLTHITEDGSNGLDLLQQILRYDLSDDDMKGRYGLFKLAIRLKEKGIYPNDYSASFLEKYLITLAKTAHNENLFSIPIPGSFSLLGLTDDYQVLEQDEVFIRAQWRTIKGSVLIYRDPIIHIGDIQAATALDEDELRRRLTKSGGIDGDDRVCALLRMDNVIFFSQKDNPPFPNRLSGGDLDGDRFEILTKDCGFWVKAYETTKHDNYTEDETPDRNKKPFDIEELATFITKYIQNDCFAELEHRLLALADQKGMKHANVKELAKWLSKAVDYPKSGIKVDLVHNVDKEPKFRVSKKPDFLHALSRRAVIDSSAGYYESHNLLGRIYREIKCVKYDYPGAINNRKFVMKLAHARALENEKHELVRKLAHAWAPEDNKHEGPKFSKDLTNFLKGVDDQVKRYKEQFCPPGAEEVYLFLQKRRGDFPNNVIQELMALISDTMVRCEIVTWSETRPPRVRPQGNHGRDTVEAMYKQYLYLAWKRSVFNDCDNRYRCKQGHGYAILCLYTLYCEELPIDT